MSFSVGVVIPVYNQGQYLGGAVRSVLGQSHPVQQIVIVNDGSTDNSLEIAQSFSESVIVVSKPNGGLSSARNAGLSQIKTEWVIFLDSDDLLSPDYVARTAEKTRGENVDIILSDYTRFADGSDPKESAAIRVARSGSLTEVLMNGGFAVHCACVKADLLRRVGPFNETLKSHEDLDLWWRMAFLDPKVTHTDVTLAYYRHTPNSLSKNLDRMYQTRLQVICSVARRIVTEPSLLAKCGDFVVNDIATFRNWLTLRRAENWEPGGRDDIGYEVLRMMSAHGFFPKRPVIQSIATFLAGSRGDELFRCWHDLLRVSGMIGPLRGLKQLLGRLTRGAK